jgi:ABC-type transport system substrate-binding protein
VKTGRLVRSLAGVPALLALVVAATQPTPPSRAADGPYADRIRIGIVSPFVRSFDGLTITSPFPLSNAIAHGFDIENEQVARFLFRALYRYDSVLGYSNPALDTLAQHGRETYDPVERARVYRDAAAILYRDLPVIPVGHSLERVALRPGLRTLTGPLELDRPGWDWRRDGLVLDAEPR